MAHLTHHLVTALPVPLLPFIRDEFALDYTRAGLVISAFGIVYGVCQLPAGWLGDRLGPRTLITTGILGVAAAGLLVGISQTYVMLLVFLVLMGILGGGYHPAATAVISATVEAKDRGRALGFHMIGGSLSYFLAPLIAAAIAALWSWRGSFIIMAIPMIPLGIILHMRIGRSVSAKKFEPRATGISHEAYAPIGWRPLLTIVVLSIFVQAVIISVVSLIPLYLVDHSGISKEAAAASMALVYAMGLWAGPLGGYLSDRLGRVSIILATCLAAGPVIYLLNLAPVGFGISAIMVIIGLLLYFNTTVTQAFIVDHTPRNKHSTMLGVYFFGTMEGSGILTPVIGYLFDRLGFYSSFSIIGAVLFALTLAGYAFWRISRK